MRGYDWYAIEISSPIISDDDHLHSHLPTVKGVIDSLKCSTKIWINSFCGFHIHASPSQHPLSLLQAKRVAALAYVVEHSVLYGSCHPCRKANTYCKPISRMSQIALGSYGELQEDYDCRAAVAALILAREKFPEKVVRDEAAMLKAIQVILSCADMKTLSQGLGIPMAKSSQDSNPRPTYRSALAISQFGTMEFRYPESSFDMEFIIFWTRLVQQIFAISSLETEEFVQKLVELYQLAISKSPNDLVEWLHALDLFPWVSFLRTRLTDYRTTLKDLGDSGIVPAE